MIKRRRAVFALFAAGLLAGLLIFTVASSRPRTQEEAGQPAAIDRIPGQPEETPTTWPGVVYTAIIVFVANVPIWIRELKKSRDFKTKNGHLTEIRVVVDKIKRDSAISTSAIGSIQRAQSEQTRSIGEIEKGISGINSRCEATVKQFETRIEAAHAGVKANAEHILTMARNGKSKTGT